MEARLLENLSNKLGDLEGKLEAYRQDLLNDFHQFYDSQLRDADPAVVCNIQQSIEPSLSSEFPGLRPYLRQRPADSVPPVSPKTAITFQTLAAPTNSGSPDAPGSARDRDHELEGVFTPSYLPLLAGSQQSLPPGASTPAHADDAAPRDSQPPPPPAGPEAGLSPSHSPKDCKMEEKTDSGAPSARSLPPLQTSGDGEAGDRASDDSNLSEASDKGDSKGIRSALRRSSSISTKTPQSPRRVRFEFKGAEVLPTSSPQPDDHMIPRPISPVPDTEQVTADSILGEDAEDSPPPRKVSSSDALRALSRAPLEEDGTVWTVVNAQSGDGSASASAQSSDTEDGYKMKQTAHNPPVAPTAKASGPPSANATQVHQEPDNTDDIGSDDDALAISKNTKPHAGTSPKGKMKQPASIESARQPDPEGDDMFHFEDDSAQPGPQPGRQPVSERREEEVEEDQDVNISGADDAGLDKSASAISSSLTISRPEPKAEKTQPTSPLASKFQIGSVGSYKGRSLIMPIVKNPELHAQAASQGDFDSFVGGVDGRSGIDESDISSYRASIAPGGFVGTPRSFTERLLMEDMEAERAKNTQARGSMLNTLGEATTEPRAATGIRYHFFWGGTWAAIPRHQTYVFLPPAIAKLANARCHCHEQTAYKMGGLNLEVFKFGMYVMFPIGIMYYFGTNLDNRFSVEGFWPRPEECNTVPRDREELKVEYEKMIARAKLKQARQQENNETRSNQNNS